MISLILAAAVSGGFQPAPCAIEGVSAEVEAQQRIECGWVSVERHPEAPDGRTIRLFAARIRALGHGPLGDPVVYINGGPGIATVDSLVPALPQSRSLALLREGRDLILFDQRGSGRSEERLCPELGARLNAIEAQGLDPEAEEEATRVAYRACRAAATVAGFDVDAYTTSATVADLEAVRRAFGIRRWNLASVSYGALVAMHAMRTHPATIRSVILSSPYPPNSASWAEQESSTAAGYAAIDRACTAQPACRERFGALLPKLEAVVLRLERAPLRIGDRRITGRLFAQALWPMAVQSTMLRFVPLAIDGAHSGDNVLIGRLVAAFASGDAFGESSPAQGYAISCHESGRTEPFYARARSLYPGLVSSAPDDSWDRLCAAYRPGFARPEFFAPVASDIPTLIFAGTLDPATPLVDALHATRFLTRSTFVQVDGASHAPLGRDECTRSIAAAFLAEPTAAPSLDCLATREPLQFALDGLEAALPPE